MEQIPKIARVRMAAQVAGAHPEAELLNAFAENALSAKERQDVLAHLADCATCREVVSLAAEARPEGAPLVKPARGGFRWATFQWAAVAASVAIVTVAVLVVGPKETRGPQPATEIVAAQKEEPARSPAPSLPTTADRKNESQSRVSAPPDLSAKLKAGKAPIAIGSGAGLGPGSGSGIGGGGYRVQQEQKPTTDPLAKLEEKKDAAASEPSGKVTPSREFGYGGAPSANATDTFTSSVRVPAVNQPAQKIAEGDKQAAQISPPAAAVDGERGRVELPTKSSGEISKDKRADADVAAEASTESAQLSSRAATGKAHYSEKPAKKTSANVAAASPMVTSFNSQVGRIWRLQSAKLESSDDGGASWNENNPAAGVQITKVVAGGDEVWAGGKAGALFVSRDSGQTWTKVPLTGDDVAPLADVTGIALLGPRVDVILSSGDDWQSKDGGKSFRLLPRKP